jgi:ankyrin repeat protein
MKKVDTIDKSFCPAGDTAALTCAAAGGHVEIVQLLLEKGASTQHKDRFQGNTALLWACQNGSDEAVRLRMVLRSTGSF